MRIETFNYTIKQYWECCNKKKRSGPGCVSGPHPDPLGLLKKPVFESIRKELQDVGDVDINDQFCRVIVSDNQSDGNGDKDGGGSVLSLSQSVASRGWSSPGSSPQSASLGRKRSITTQSSDVGGGGGI